MAEVVNYQGWYRTAIIILCMFEVAHLFQHLVAMTIAWPDKARRIKDVYIICVIWIFAVFSILLILLLRRW